MSFQIVKGDIFQYSADTIVLPANPKPVVGNGLDALIYEKAGKSELLDARKRIGDLEFGQCAITGAYRLSDQYQYIIHCVSPDYDDGEGDADQLLKSCYQNALELAYSKRCKSIVFPLLSTGALHFPKERAQNIAEGVCHLFVVDHEIDVKLVIYQKKRLSRKEMDDLTTYITENSYHNLDEKEYERIKNLPEEREEHQLLELMKKQIERKKFDEEREKYYLQRRNGRAMEGKTLEEVLKEKRSTKSFETVLAELRDKHNVENNNQLCARINMKCATLSRICTESRKSVNRDHIWMIAYGLGITEFKEVDDLLIAAGLDATPYTAEAELRERVLEFGIKNHWNLFKVNDALEEKKMDALVFHVKEDDRDKC